MNYKTTGAIGKHPKGVIVTEKDFAEEGRPAELVRRGLLIPTDGFIAIPESEDDLEGYKRHAEALKEENHKLRNAGGESALLAENEDLKAVNNNLTAENEKLTMQVTELEGRVVPIGVHQNLVDQHEQLKKLHETTAAELEKVKKKKAD
jgi:hypothetical protein